MRHPRSVSRRLGDKQPRTAVEGAGLGEIVMIGIFEEG